MSKALHFESALWDLLVTFGETRSHAGSAAHQFLGTKAIRDEVQVIHDSKSCTNKGIYICACVCAMISYRQPLGVSFISHVRLPINGTNVSYIVIWAISSQCKRMCRKNLAVMRHVLVLPPLLLITFLLLCFLQRINCNYFISCLLELDCCKTVIYAVEE